MANVSVEKAAVINSTKLCKTAIDKFTNTSRHLSEQYQHAGSGWKDDKYKQLGDIVTKCTKALEQPIKDLESCQNNLGELLSAIEKYEDINF